jgi:hypothetical protein
MIGKNPLWVSKQHGHSVTTMLCVYTACAEGAIEADIEAIKRAMKRRPGKLLEALKSLGQGQRWRGTPPNRVITNAALHPSRPRPCRELSAFIHH